jgi:hypothetical protein
VTPAEQYRKLAAEISSRVSNEERANRVLTHAAEAAALRAELEECYILLAEQADKNNRVDVT